MNKELKHTPKEFKLSDEQKLQFEAMFILNKMINCGLELPVMLEGDNCWLEAPLKTMLGKELVDVPEGKVHYAVTDKGRTTFKRFMFRYLEYLKVYDLYCAVDLEAGEFAFDQFFELGGHQDSEEWYYFLNDTEDPDDSRWKDMRIAVAVYKGVDPLEIIFMSFLNSGVFESQENGEGADSWQLRLASEETWDEIVHICNTQIRWEELGEELDDAIDEIEEMIFQGSFLMKKLLEQENEIEAEAEEDKKEESGGNGGVTETITTETIAEEDKKEESGGNGGVTETITTETITKEEDYAPHYDDYCTGVFYVSPYWSDPRFNPWLW